MSTLSPAARTVALVFLGLVLVLGALWGSRPLIHDDLFFHMGTGQYVVENLEVPTTDIFSFTRGGERWVSHEWGFGVVTHFFWFTKGYWALVGLKAGLTVAILLSLFALMTWRADGGLSMAPSPLLVALLAVGLWAINDEVILRASLFSSLFVLALLGLLLWFDRRGSRLSFVAIALLFLIWGNFHGEVLFGLFILGLATTEALLGRWQGDNGRIPATLLQADPGRPYLALFAVSFLLTLANPNGYQVLLYPFRLAWFLGSRGDTLEMGHFTGATPASSAGFYLLVAILLLGLLPIERLRVLSLTDVATVSAFLMLSIKSHRFVFFFVLFSLPVIVRLFSDRQTESPTWIRSPRVRLYLVSFTMLLVAAAAAAAWRGHERTPVSHHFPSGAVEYLQQSQLTARPFNHQNYGGYLGWQLKEPIFWDGRNLLFASLMTEVAQMPLEKVVEMWQIESLVLTEFEYQQMVDQIVPAQWALVYWDDYTALFLHREGAPEALLEQTELRQLPPFGGVEGLNDRAQDAAWVARARRELDQILDLEPACQRALYFHGLISFYNGDLGRAEKELRRALEHGPNTFVEKALMRVLESTGQGAGTDSS